MIPLDLAIIMAGLHNEETFLVSASEPLVPASEPPVASELVDPRRTLSRTAGPDGSVRRCRDTPWLVLFALYWLGMLVIAGCAVREGDPRRLIQGMDDEDQLCGGPGLVNESNGSLESRPFVYFACLQYGSRRPTICVQSCPALSGHYVHWYNGTIIHCNAGGTHGRSIPATTYPSTQLRNSCVPSTPSLYVLVAAIIDLNAFTSVIKGMLLAWPVVAVAAAAASLLALSWMASGAMAAWAQCAALAYTRVRSQFAHL